MTNLFCGVLISQHEFLITVGCVPFVGQLCVFAVRRLGKSLSFTSMKFMQDFINVSYSIKMVKRREKSLKNRVEILKHCYPLLATGSWDATSVADLEKAITQTKGAIVYYFKNKHNLFHSIMDELFFPVFEMSEKVWEKLSRCSITKFHQRYKTPFERVRDDLAENYGIDNSSRALFNIFIQGSKHYEGFSTKINDSMKLEEEYKEKKITAILEDRFDLSPFLCKLRRKKS